MNRYTPASKQTERRRHPRCPREMSIYFGFMNSTQRHQGLVQNYSQFGMFFETDIPLVVDSILVIRTTGCHLTTADDSSGSEVPPPYCSPSNDDAWPCQNVKTVVVGQVKRCVRQSDADEADRYGIAVKYLHVAV